MNQQEIDRLCNTLFEKYCIHATYGGPSIGRPSFNSAIREAAAEIRRQALEEAAKWCMELSAGFAIEDMHPQHLGASDCAWSIRALAQSEQEKS